MQIKLKSRTYHGVPEMINKKTLYIIPLHIYVSDIIYILDIKTHQKTHNENIASLQCIKVISGINNCNGVSARTTFLNDLHRCHVCFIINGIVIAIFESKACVLKWKVLFKNSASVFTLPFCHLLFTSEQICTQCIHLSLSPNMPLGIFPMVEVVRTQCPVWLADPWAFYVPWL